MKLRSFIAVLTFVLSGLPAVADETVRSIYQTSYMGLPVSRAFIVLHLNEGGYEFTGKGRASALASLFKPMDAELKAKGRFVGNAVKPESFDADIKGKKDGYLIALEMQNGKVLKETSLPKRENLPPDFVPVTENMKQGVIDPLAAFLIPVKTGSLEEVCKRTLPVYTGRERFDLVLTPDRKEAVTVPGLFQGEALVCKGRYQPLGGHRAEKPEVKYMIENTDMEAAFVPLPGGKVMGLYRVSIGTKLGPVTVELEKAVVEPPKLPEKKS
ncbi:MAG: DUF3108 domain-containing protein [Pseudomonadota bacterium]